MSSEVVFPGNIIDSANEFDCGTGCYLKDGVIRSSLYGKVFFTNNSSPTQKKTINVSPEGGIGVVEQINVEDKVVCQVIKLNTNQAIVNIIAARDNKLTYPPKGLIRREDILGNSDTIPMHHFFRPGDIVRAEVVSLGDMRYYLTTNGEDLGVIEAVSQQGNKMNVSGPQEMKDPITGIKEHRQVPTSLQKS